MVRFGNNTAFRAALRAEVKKVLVNHYGTDLRGITLKDIKKPKGRSSDEPALRAYPNLGGLRFEANPGEILPIPKNPSVTNLAEAKNVKLAGEDFTEHSAGGDATRLGMGAKFVIEPLQLARQAKLTNMDPNERTIDVPVSPASLLPISIGKRHMVQFAYDLTQLAVNGSLNPAEVLKSQFMLITLNPKTAESIIQEFVQYNFFGFSPERVMFMVDQVYPGMDLKDGELVFIQNSPINLYNHGHMVFQETMEGEIFTVAFDRSTGEIKKNPLKTTEVEAILEKMKNKMSVPIEDNDYLMGGSIDLNSLSFALALGRDGYRMAMEVVGQKPYPDSQKGGFFAYDPTLSRGVMIESDSGGSVVDGNDKCSLAQIKYLNRNFNLFPSPADVFRALANQGLPFLHPVIKDGYLYLAPPQGDQNFLVKTAFVQRELSPGEKLPPINNLKDLGDTGKTLKAMLAQDQQYGFADFVRQLGIIK